MVPSHAVYARAPIWASNDNLGFHARGEGTARAFLGQPEADHRTFHRLAGFVRDLNLQSVMRAATGLMDGSFTHQHANLQYRLGLCGEQRATYK
jgi:hypothetical protein